MKRYTHLCWFACVTLAMALCASCAPVGTPFGEKDPLDVIPPKAGQKAAQKAIKQAVDFPQRKDQLQERIEVALGMARQRQLRSDNGFWTVFHGILGLGPKVVTLLDADTGERVNALEHICKGGAVRGLQFVPSPYGVDVISGEVFVSQGHQDQFIAEMAQWGVPAKLKFNVQGRDYTFLDFVHHAQMRASVTERQELSWAILVIGQYLGTKLTWKNGKGEPLTFEDIVRYEVDADVENAACGGTHRLFGLTWAYHLHLQQGGKVEGVWKDMAGHLEKYKARARKFRNGDGSFSTEFFRGPGNAPDLSLRMNTTGHMVEWLALALNDEELRSAWMEDAVNALTRMFFESRNDHLEGGMMYHAAHGLLIYYARRYDPRRLEQPPLGLQCPLVPLPGKTLGH
ncbi:MAG: hypothetical protein L0Z62_41420 [Gemmataceae bacterium]|nr:hypothetical protein [Gemmataceae bacterium]